MILGFIGTTEVVVILIIALLVFGPQKLPEVGRQIGSLYQELNRMRGDVQKALDLNEYTNYDSNPYSKGYTYDTQVDQDGVHDLHEHSVPQIEAPSVEAGTIVAPPGPQGTVASTSPFAARSSEMDWSGGGEAVHADVNHNDLNPVEAAETTTASAESNPAMMHKESNLS